MEGLSVREKVSGLKLLHVVEVSEVEVPPRIVPIGFGVRGDVAELRAADPGEGLTRRPADDDVHTDGNVRPKSQRGNEVLRVRDLDVARLGMCVVLAWRQVTVEVQSMGFRCNWIALHCGDDFETGGLQPK
jgi:hypothetical protein